MLLGYDVDSAAVAANQLGELPCPDAMSSEELSHAEEDILSLFVDIISLFRREPAAGPDDDEFIASRRSSEEYLFDYLRRTEAAGEGLPTPFLDQLRRTLQHFGVDSLDPSADLQQALFRIAQSHQRMKSQTGPLLSVLEDRLTHGVAGAGADLGRLLDRVIVETRRRFPAVNDMARELAYRTFDEPFLDEIRQADYAEAEKQLAGGRDRSGRIRPVGARRCTRRLRPTAQELPVHPVCTRLGTGPGSVAGGDDQALLPPA